jgi:hypothetical protein
MRQNVTLPLEMGEGFAGDESRESCTGIKMPVAPDREFPRLTGAGFAGDRSRESCTGIKMPVVPERE